MSSSLERDLCCPVCRDIFHEPVILGCSHTFCQRCLERHWTQTDGRLCPLCRRRHSKERLPPNLVVKMLCEKVSRERSKHPERQDACGVHAREYKLFCLDHGELVCVVCRDAARHASHSFRPVDEAAAERRRVLQAALPALRSRLEDLRLAGVKVDEAAEHIKVQARRTERNIKETYEELRQFLARDEEARTAALREEEEQKSRMMKERMESLGGQIQALSEAIAATEEELGAEDVPFLLGYQAAEERVQRWHLADQPPPPPPPSEAHVDMAKHLGNLKYHIWSRMRAEVSYTPLILDPNTADPDAVLTDDMTSLAARKTTPELRENPESKVQEFSYVLGSRGFDSGSHSWDVDVGDNEEWKLGVAAESVRGKTYQLSGLWIIDLHHGRLRAMTPSHSYTPFSVGTRPRRIRVKLNWNRGKLTFFDLDTQTDIFTINSKFTERMFPYLCTADHPALRALPVEVPVSVEPYVVNV